MIKAGTHMNHSEPGDYYELWEWLNVAHGVDLSIKQLRMICRKVDETREAMGKEERNQCLHAERNLGE